MQIIVKSKKDAEAFTCFDPWAAISISTYPEEFAKLSKDNRVGLLQLAFRDTEFPKQEGAFTRTEANKILAFFDKVSYAIPEILLIHCEAGLSRSPAVAAALSGNKDYWFKHYQPNTLVYNILYGMVKEKKLKL